MRLAMIAALALLAAPAVAQTGSSSMSSSMSGSMHHSGAMHTMPATVTAVDAKTGLVDVTSAGMALKLHFPPSALSDLKAGDKITLHLGFTKP